MNLKKGDEMEFRLAIAKMSNGTFSFHSKLGHISEENVEEIMRSVPKNPMLQEINLGVGLSNNPDLANRFSEVLVDAVLAGSLRRVILQCTEMQALFFRNLKARTLEAEIPLTELFLTGVNGEEFSSLLRKCKSLVKLTYKVGKLEAPTIFEAVAASNVQQFHVRQRSACELDLKFLASLLERSAAITDFSILYFGNVLLRPVFDAMKANAVVKKFKVRQNRDSMRSEDVEAFASLLEADNCPITHLTFWDTGLRQNRTRLIEALRKNTSLVDLIVNHDPTTYFDPGKDLGFSSEESLSLFESLRHHGVKIERLSFACVEMTPELLEGISDFVKECNELKYLNVSSQGISGRCSRQHVISYCEAVLRIKSLENFVLYLNDLGEEDVARVLEAVLSNEKTRTLELRHLCLTRNIGRGIQRVLAHTPAQSLQKLSLHQDYGLQSEGGNGFVIAAIAMNTSLREIRVNGSLLNSKSCKMFRVAGLMNSTWREGGGAWYVQQNQYLFSLLGGNEDMILMRASVTLKENNLFSESFSAKLGIARSEDGGTLRLVIVSEYLGLLHDITITRDVSFARNAKTRTAVTLRYLNKDGKKKSVSFDFSTAGHAEELISLLGSESDFHELYEQRLVTLGEANADRFSRLVNMYLSSRKMAALVAGMTRQEDKEEELVYAVKGGVWAHLREALMEK